VKDSLVTLTFFYFKCLFHNFLLVEQTAVKLESVSQKNLMVLGMFSMYKHPTISCTSCIVNIESEKYFKSSEMDPDLV